MNIERETVQKESPPSKDIIAPRIQGQEVSNIYSYTEMHMTRVARKKLSSCQSWFCNYFHQKASLLHNSKGTLRMPPVRPESGLYNEKCETVRWCAATEACPRSFLPILPCGVGLPLVQKQDFCKIQGEHLECRCLYTTSQKDCNPNMMIYMYIYCCI